MTYSDEVEQLLVNAIHPLPLIRAELPAFRAHLKWEDSVRLFPNARDAPAALAGLALQLGDWECAHDIAQHVETANGSYWHAIVHRIEPDYFNSQYWFRRVGRHPVFAQIAPLWTPDSFAQQVQQAIESKDNRKIERVKEMQQAEISKLFDYCAL